MNRFLTATAIVALLPGAVTADGVNFAQLTFDRNNYSAGSDDTTVTQFVGELEYQVGEIIVTGALENTSTDNDDVESSIRELTLSGAYFVNPEVLIGLTATNVDEDQSGATLAGAFVQYRNNQIGTAIRILQSFDSNDRLYLGVATFEAAPGVELGAGLMSGSASDGTGYVISAEYDRGQIDGRAYVAGNTDADDNIFGVRGAYAFGGAFRGTAAFESISGGAVEYTSYNVGAGYKVADGAWIDASIGQIDRNGGANIDAFNLSLSFETGRQTRLDRAFERDLRDDFNSGAQQLTDASGTLTLN